MTVISNELVDTMKKGRDALIDIIGEGNATPEQAETAIRGIKAAHEASEIQAKAAESAAIVKSIGDLNGENRVLAGDPQSAPQVVIAQARKELGQNIIERKSGAVSIPRRVFNAKAPTSTFTSPDLVGQDLGAMSRPMPNAATSLRDVFPTQLITSPRVRFYQVGAPSQGADITAEGEIKPEILNDVEAVDAEVVKLAGHFKVSMELQADAGYIVDQIFGQAQRTLIQRENALLLDTMGKATGINSTTGTSAQAFDLVAGAIGVQESVNGLPPEVLIINPLDLASLRLAKASGSGEYIADPMTTAPDTLFGMQLFSTTSCPKGTMWLTRKNAGTFYQLSNPMLTTGLDGDDLIRNMTTVVIEERVLPAITQPSMLTQITLSD